MGELSGAGGAAGIRAPHPSGRKVRSRVWLCNHGAARGAKRCRRRRECYAGTTTRASISSSRHHATNDHSYQPAIAALTISCHFRHLGALQQANATCFTDNSPRERFKNVTSATISRAISRTVQVRLAPSLAPVPISQACRRFPTKALMLRQHSQTRSSNSSSHNRRPRSNQHHKQQQHRRKMPRHHYQSPRCRRARIRR